MARINGKLEEGLRLLAGMLADAYRRRAAGEIIYPPVASERDNPKPISESEIIKRIEPSDSPPGYVYTEYVRVENFLRNKGSIRKNREGGQDVKQGSIGGSEAAPAGQDKAGGKKGRG